MLSILTLRIMTFSNIDTQNNDVQHEVTCVINCDTQHDNTVYRVSLCWVPHLINCYAECRYVECRYAECHFVVCCYTECCYCECCYGECRILFIVILSVFMLSDVGPG